MTHIDMGHDAESTATLTAATEAAAVAARGVRPAADNVRPLEVPQLS
jgi:hypothetical protein